MQIDLENTNIPKAQSIVFLTVIRENSNVIRNGYVETAEIKWAQENNNIPNNQLSQTQKF